MPSKIYREIASLIGKIVIFSPSFKREIIFNLRQLEPERWPHLAEVLREVVLYQEAEIKKILAKQPNFLAEQKTKQLEARRESLKSLGETVKVKDSKKINSLIQKIKNII